MGRLAQDLKTFYRSERGEALNRELGHCLMVNWQEKDLESHHLLCLGYPPPGIKKVLKKGKSAGVFLPSLMGPQPFKLKGKNISTCGDEVRLPFRPGSYDSALIFHALEYMEDPVSFMEEVWKVLSPGAHLLIMAPNYNGAWKKSGIPLTPEMQAFKYKDVKALLVESGFSLIDSYGVMYGLPVGFFTKMLFSGVLRTLSGGTLAGFPGFLIFEAKKRTGPEKIKFKDPLRVVPGVRVNPELTPE